MRITFDIDKHLLKAVIKTTGEENTSKAVHAALEEYLRHHREKRLLELHGKLNLDINDWYEFRHME